MGAVAGSHDDLWFPNGIVVLGDDTLVVAESHADRLTAWTITESGDLIDRRVWADLGPGSAPDGICSDAEGAIWYASVPGQRCTARRPGGRGARHGRGRSRLFRLHARRRRRPHVIHRRQPLRPPWRLGRDRARSTCRRSTRRPPLRTRTLAAKRPGMHLCCTSPSSWAPFATGNDERARFATGKG